MKAKERYWYIMAEIIKWNACCTLKLASYAKWATWSSVIAAVVSCGALGAVLYTHDKWGLAVAILAQVYQAALPYLPYVKNRQMLEYANNRLDVIMANMEARWQRIDSATDDDILADAKRYDESYTKIMQPILQAGISFNGISDEAELQRDNYLNRFSSETAFAKEDKPEA